MKKTHKYINHLSIFFILVSYVVSSIQITAQDILAQESISDQVLEESQQVEREPYIQGEEADESIDIDETDESDLTLEINNNEDGRVIFPEELIEESADASDIEDYEVSADVEVVSTDGYSHVETSPGTVVATTPNDATLESLVDYLDEYFQVTAIKSLTVQGMISSGSNENYNSSFGLARFTELSYLEMTDLETVGQGALLFLSNLSELYLPKVTTIGPLAFWNNSSMLKINAPLVEVVEMNAFYGVTTLEVLNTPSWYDIDVMLSALGGSSESLKEISISNFSFKNQMVHASTFPNVEKQTINKAPHEDTRLRPHMNHLVFENVTELIVNGFTTVVSTELPGDYSNVRKYSSNTLTAVYLSGFTSLEEIDFDDKLVSLWADTFSGTKIETLRLSSLRLNMNTNAFRGAEYLKEIYLPVIRDTEAAGLVNLPNNVEIVGTTSTRLTDFQNTLDANPNVLFAATESNESLALEDKQITIGGSETLKLDFSNYILNEDLSLTAFELTQNWFFEDELIGTSDTYTITNMNQSNVGEYHYSVNIIPTGGAIYSGSRESRKAQVDIVNEISFTSDFSVNSVVGELINLEVLFKSNVTNMNASFQLIVPEPLKVDDELIDIYLDNSSSSLPLGAIVTFEENVITISNFPLLVGFNYHIDIPIMPIAISEQLDEIQIEFIGNYDPLVVSGEVLITPGEFNVYIPNQIDFEEVSLDSSSIQSIIQKENTLDIGISSFTAQEESWEIMVSATPFLTRDNQQIGEESICLIYKENGNILNLSEEISFASGSFSGKLDYNFRTDTWENTSHVLTELEEEGFHVLVGNDYYKLESKQSYTTEVNFTIQYSP